MSANLPKIWKKSFKSGVVIIAKMMLCNQCDKKIVRNSCSDQNNKNRKFGANLNLLKRQACNQFGHMLPYHK